MLLELMNAVSAKPTAGTKSKGAIATNAHTYKTISETLERMHGPLLDLYEELRAYLNALGDDVQEKTLRFYIAFKRIKNFACVEVRPTKGAMLIYLKIDPEQHRTGEGFFAGCKKYRPLRHGRPGVDRSGNQKDLEKAKMLLQASYDAN